MMHRQLWTRVGLGALLIASGGCEATLGSDVEGSSEDTTSVDGGLPGQPGQPGQPGEEGDGDVGPIPGTGGATLDCSAPQGSAVELRLLTPSQYDNTLRDVFQLEGSWASGFSQGLDDIALEQRADVAATVAADLAQNLAAWAPCFPTEGDSSSCKSAIIDQVGARAYRHPLTADEHAELDTLFQAGIDEADFSTGVEWFITGLLQSPDFMYQVVRVTADEVAGTSQPLSAHEYASRLAYFLWDGPPDEELTAAAERGDLADSALRAQEIGRMIEDPRFLRGVEQFYRNWLPMKGFASIARDAEGFDQEVVAALSTSLLMSATELYKQPNPNITELFSGETYFLNGTLREFYGLGGGAETFEPTPMPGEARRGILTHPAVMALLARPEESFPIGRGLHVLHNVLCRTIPAPTGIEIPPLPPVQDGVSTRQRVESHTSSPVCQGCHSSINPAGFAFEAFDEVGRFRTVDHGQPVDTSGNLNLGIDVDGEFSTGEELLDRLGNSDSVRECFAEQVYLHALDRLVPDSSDACALQTLEQSFTTNGDLEQLVLEVASSESFRMRRVEGATQ